MSASALALTRWIVSSASAIAFWSAAVRRPEGAVAGAGAEGSVASASPAGSVAGATWTAAVGSSAEAETTTWANRKQEKMGKRRFMR